MSDLSPYITYYESIGGWKAVLIWWNGEIWEPYQTGVGAYGTPEEAESEARWWAESEGIRYRAPEGEAAS